MARVRWDIVVLGVILLALFWVRMELAVSVDALSYDSYLTVREEEHIRETGRPLSFDQLSVTGSKRMGSSLYAYLLAGMLLLGESMYKLLPNLLMVGVLIPIFYLTRSFTKSNVAATIAVILGATAPSVFSSHLNTPSSTPLAILLFVVTILLLQNPEKHLYWIVACTLTLTFLSPLVFVLVLSLLMIIILLRIEGFGLDRRINELFFFTLVLAVWFNVLIYKKALFTQGLRILWQNLPIKYAALQFGSVTFLSVLYGLGVVTFLFGAFGTYHVLFESRVKSSYAIVGAILSIFLLMLIQVIEIQLGLVLLSLFLSIMAGYGIMIATKYVSRTKFPWLTYPVTIVIVLLFIFTAILPALAEANTALENTPSAEDIAAFKVLQTRIPHGAVILTTVREGAAVQYYSQHTTMTDDDFLLMKNGDELVKDIDSVYEARFALSVVGKAEKLGFTHVVFSNDAVRQYSRRDLAISDHRCIVVSPLSENVKLYHILCAGGVR